MISFHIHNYPGQQLDLSSSHQKNCLSYSHEYKCVQKKKFYLGKRLIRLCRRYWNAVDLKGRWSAQAGGSPAVNVSAEWWRGCGGRPVWSCFQPISSSHQQPIMGAHHGISSWEPIMGPRCYSSSRVGSEQNAGAQNTRKLNISHLLQHPSPSTPIHTCLCPSIHRFVSPASWFILQRKHVTMVTFT